jgi:hypothetical protein
MLWSWRATAESPLINHCFGCPRILYFLKQKIYEWKTAFVIKQMKQPKKLSRFVNWKSYYINLESVEKHKTLFFFWCVMMVIFFLFTVQWSKQAMTTKLTLCGCWFSALFFIHSLLFFINFSPARFTNVGRCTWPSKYGLYHNMSVGSTNTFVKTISLPALSFPFLPEIGFFFVSFSRALFN